MKFFLLLLYLTSILYSDNHKQSSYKNVVSNYGFYSKGSFLSNFKDSKLALTMLGEEIAKIHKTKINIIFYEKNIDLYRDFVKNEEITMIALETNFFYKYRKEINKLSNLFWTISFDGKRHRQLYLISNHKGNSSKDIKNKTISINRHDETAFTWINKMSLKLSKKPISKFIKNLAEERSESVALLKVFFKKSDMAIVTKRTWDTMIELNPSIKKKIKIIKKSKYNQIPVIGIFRKNTSSFLLNTFFSFTGNLNSNLRNKQIINILKIDHLYKIKKQSIDELGIYYKEYLLKIKYIFL